MHENKLNEAEAWFRSTLCHPVRKCIGPAHYNPQGPHRMLNVIASYEQHAILQRQPSTARRFNAAHTVNDAEHVVNELSPYNSVCAALLMFTMYH